jgi:hypothetical protein
MLKVGSRPRSARQPKGATRPEGDIRPAAEPTFARYVIMANYKSSELGQQRAVTTDRGVGVDPLGAVMPPRARLGSLCGLLGRLLPGAGFRKRHVASVSGKNLAEPDPLFAVEALQLHLLDHVVIRRSGVDLDPG